MTTHTATVTRSGDIERFVRVPDDWPVGATVEVRYTPDAEETVRFSGPNMAADAMAWLASDDDDAPVSVPVDTDELPQGIIRSEDGTLRIKPGVPTPEGWEAEFAGKWLTGKAFGEYRPVRRVVPVDTDENPGPRWVVDSASQSLVWRDDNGGVADIAVWVIEGNPDQDAAFDALVALVEAATAPPAGESILPGIWAARLEALGLVEVAAGSPNFDLPQRVRWLIPGFDALEAATAPPTPAIVDLPTVDAVVDWLAEQSTGLVRVLPEDHQIRWVLDAVAALTSEETDQ